MEMDNGVQYLLNNIRINHTVAENFNVKIEDYGTKVKKLDVMINLVL